MVKSKKVKNNNIFFSIFKIIIIIFIIIIILAEMDRNFNSKKSEVTYTIKFYYYTLFPMPLLGFYNTTGISKNGMVTFTASLLDSRKAIVLWRDGVLHTIASEGDNNISEIEMFAPKINNQGIVLFRALDNTGARGLYLANQKGVERIIGEGDEVMTDLGAGKILSNPNYPGFSGEVDFNDQGEIVFHCGLNHH